MIRAIEIMVTLVAILTLVALLFLKMISNLKELTILRKRRVCLYSFTYYFFQVVIEILLHPAHRHNL